MDAVNSPIDSHDPRHASQCGLRLLQRLLRPLGFGDVDKNTNRSSDLAFTIQEWSRIAQHFARGAIVEYHGDLGFAKFLPRSRSLLNRQLTGRNVLSVLDYAEGRRPPSPRRGF
jgi:hypothetical protein